MIKIKFHKRAAKIAALSKNCYLDIQIKTFFCFKDIWQCKNEERSCLIFLLRRKAISNLRRLTYATLSSMYTSTDVHQLFEVGNYRLST